MSLGKNSISGVNEMNIPTIKRIISSFLDSLCSKIILTHS